MVEIVARFYKVLSEHVKRDVLSCAFMFVSNFPVYVSAKNWQNWITSF